MFDVARHSEAPGYQGPSAAVIFEPDVVAVMRAALEASWAALAFSHFENEQEMRATREELARRILEAAAEGERRVPVLSGRALGALEPRRSGRSEWPASRYVS